MSAPHLNPWLWRELLMRELELPESVQELPLEAATGRVLAAEVRSPEPLPAVPIAAMDGFAVRRADLTVLGSTTLPVSAELPARPGEVGVLAVGTAARIMTGAPVPIGADAVIEVEATDTDPFGPQPDAVILTLDAEPPADRHIRRPGEEIAQGQLLARAGERVGGGLVGLARALGIAALAVRRPVRVCVVVTGDELTSGDSAPGTVRESNGEMLGAALAADGAEAQSLHSIDTHDGLRATLERAAGISDLVLTTGGIGQGAYDVVKTLLGERGAGTSHFAHLALRPGGPQGYGRLPGGTPVIHLPGTPVGALVGYHLFVRPLLPGTDARPRRVRRDLDGAVSSPRPGTLQARPGLLGRDAAGRETVQLLPGRRLAPFGRADAIVLEESGPDQPDVLILPL